MKTQYAIYKLYLSEDNYKEVEGTRLVKVFDDFNEANNFFREETIAFIRKFGFSENDYDYYEELSRNVIDFFKTKLGIDDGFFEYEVKYLSDSEVLEFSEKFELIPYELRVLNETDKQYAIWLNYANRYLFTIHRDTDILVENKKDLQAFIDALNEYSPTATLEELTDKPILLNSYLIQKTVNYIDNRLRIVQNADEFTSISFNYLGGVNYVLINK